MRDRLLPALACLVALGCAHRHLLLQQAPVGTHAVADHAASTWRITLRVLGTGWEVSSPEPSLVLETRAEGEHTRIQWTVSEARWKAQEDYPITLRKDGGDLVLKVRNRSREAQVAEGVAIGVAVVAVVVLAVASGKGNHGGSGLKGAPKTLPHPNPSGGPRIPAGGHAGPALEPLPQPGLVLSDHPVQAEPEPEPLVALETEDGAEVPGELSSFLRPVPEGWEVGVELRFLPRNELWTVAGDGFEVAGDSGDRELSATWRASRADWGRGRVFVLDFTGPDRGYRVLVRLQ